MIRDYDDYVVIIRDYDDCVVTIRDYDDYVVIIRDYDVVSCYIFSFHNDKIISLFIKTK